MKKNFKYLLILPVVLVVLFWPMPNEKIIVIGDFFEKVIKPIAVPLTIIFLMAFGLKEVLDRFNK